MKQNRRRSERIDTMISVKYSSDDNHITGCSLTKDLSLEGLGLPLNGKPPSGSKLALLLTIYGTMQKTIPAVATVVWARRNFEHWKPKYSSGLRFITINEDDRKALMDYARDHRYVKTDFERALEDNKIPILGGRGDF